jgi:divalent metal cation (Fe/Co/Zn/Cd) transporter
VSRAHRELPQEKEQMRRKAIRLERLSIAYLLTAIVLVFLTLGNSQAMKTVWVEDILSLIPPASFLFATRFQTRAPDRQFPYGYHRATSVAYLAGSVALLTFGLFILGDSLLKLVTFEHPSVGTVVLFGHQIWLGWLMLPTLVWSGLPALFLGRAKLPLARGLHDKALFASAEMMRADWLTAAAGMAGVIGIGLGLWWADAVAASFIAFDITRDGYVNLRQVTKDLMDHVPMRVDHSAIDPLPARVESFMEGLPWVREARVRFREEGHVYFGEIYVVPSSEANITEHIERAHQELERMDWRLHDVVIAPAHAIPDELHDVEDATH